MARTCEVCSVEYRHTYWAQRTCGRACGWTLRRAARKREPQPTYPATRVYFRSCRQCESLFVSGHPQRSVCSDSCRAARRVDSWAQDTRRPPVNYIRQCGCGAALPRDRRKCDACVEATYRDGKRRRRHRDRARRRSVRSEPYTLAAIAERDSWSCGLCTRPVDMALRVPDPQAPTIDHVLPLAKGGDDMSTNVQLAHFLCNSRKGAGDTGRLALIN
jgi:HNH endonuclease